MTIYWSQNDIPALKGLSAQERMVAKKSVIGKVWRHWQVWLPFAVQILAYIAFLLFAPSFPYRFWIVIFVIVVTAKMAGLPFNHYLQHYLSQNAPKS